MLWLARLAVLGLLAASASGCKQGAGERCQVDSDCDDGLKCVLPNGATPQSGGTCQPPGGFADMAMSEADMTVLPDMAVLQDLSGTD
jgi:hypothetical protein